MSNGVQTHRAATQRTELPIVIIVEHLEEFYRNVP